MTKPSDAIRSALDPLYHMLDGFDKMLEDAEKVLGQPGDVETTTTVEKKTVDGVVVSTTVTTRTKTTITTSTSTAGKKPEMEKKP